VVLISFLENFNGLLAVQLLKSILLRLEVVASCRVLWSVCCGGGWLLSCFRSVDCMLTASVVFQYYL
jgi:hypothetical protein